MSYQTLERSLGLEKALPVSENWSAAADFLQLLTDYCLNHRPKTIVECSSGTSSLENGEPFVRQTRQQLHDFSLEQYCDVIHAPLQDYVIDGDPFQWYDLASLPAVDIDLLVVDGPPGFIQNHSRYPALPLLDKLLAKQCTVYLDDAAREDERAIVKRWSMMFPEFQIEYVANERGCSILKRRL